METLRRLVEKLFGPYPVTTTFGADGARGTGKHYGIDIATPWGTAVHARQGGRVTDVVAYDAIGGRQVELEVASGHRVRYAHLSDVLVDEGAEVFPGQAVARSGDSGRVTGSHLHVEVKDRGGSFVDPVELFAIDAGEATPAKSDECPPGHYRNLFGWCVKGSGGFVPDVSPLPTLPLLGEDFGTKENPNPKAPDQDENPLDALNDFGEQLKGTLAGVTVGAVLLLVIVFVAFLGLKNVAEV